MGEGEKEEGAAAPTVQKGGQAGGGGVAET